MAQETTTSAKYSLNWQDLGKGFLVAFISSLTTGLYQFIEAAINSGNMLILPTVKDLQTIGYVALFSGLSYLIKNFVTPTQTIINKP